MSTELPVLEERRAHSVRPGPLRVALAASLVLHGCAFYWLLERDHAAAPDRALRSFELTLIRSTSATSPAWAPSASPSPAQSDAAPEAQVPDAAVPDAPGRRQRGFEAQAVPRTLAPGPLDLSLPADVLRPEAAPERETRVFDPELGRRIDRARDERRGPAAWAGSSSWPIGAGDRTRIETDSGCFERVRDPFGDAPGEQWWMVACGGESEIDWAQRFRARP